MAQLKSGVYLGVELAAYQATGSGGKFGPTEIVMNLMLSLKSYC